MTVYTVGESLVLMQGGEKEFVGPGYAEELAHVFDHDRILGVQTLQQALHAGVVFPLLDVGVVSGKLALEIVLQVAKKIEDPAVNLEKTDGVFLLGDFREHNEVFG